MTDNVHYWPGTEGVLACGLSTRATDDLFVTKPR